MNKRGAGPNFTIFFIGLAIFLMIFILGTQIYVDLMANNGGSIDSEYTTTYAQIAGYNSSFTGTVTGINDRDLWVNIPQGVASTFNVIVIGLGGIATLFDFIAVVPSLFGAIFGGLGGIPAIFISMMTVIITIFLIMTLWKAAAKAPDQP